VGDDTLHTPLPYFGSPAFIASTPPAGGNDVTIDLVFVEFIGSEVVQVLNGLQSDKKYSSADVATYSSVLLDTVLGEYASAKWK
jgi:hypothetical protein